MPFTIGTWMTEAIKRWVDYWVLLNSHFNEVYIAFYKLLLHREHYVRHNFLIYIWRTRSHLGTLNTVFLDVWLSHKARYQLTQARSGLRLLPQFLGAFSQGQMLTHTGKVPLLALTEERRNYVPTNLTKSYHKWQKH
jgi:hypothetical protein